MKKTVKTLTALGLAGVMATMSACGLIEREDNTTPAAAGNHYGGPAGNNISPGGLPGDQINLEDWGTDFAASYFMSFTGTITEINPVYNSFGEDAAPEEGMYFVSIETADGNPMNFIVDLTTAVLVDGELSEGMVITGHYDGLLPVPMIWPPQHHAVAITQYTGSNVLLSRFDADFASTNGPHSLAITPETQIVFQDGQPFEGELSELVGRKLVVEFDEEGLVISPSKITILWEIAVHPILTLSPDELAGMGLGLDTGIAIPGGPALLSPEDISYMLTNMFDTENGQIIVNDEVIEAPTPFINEEDLVIMLPLAAIAEALGYTAIVDGNEVIIAPGTIVTEGVNSYARGREVARVLSSAPIMHDGVLFVPSEFFQEILSGAAMFMDGNVYIVPLV